MAVESMSCGISFIVFEALIRDIDLSESFVRNGLEIVSEEYTIDNYAARHLDLYNQLITL